MMKQLVVAISMALLLGCDAASDAMKVILKEDGPTTIVIRPGFELQLADKSLPFLGNDICPVGEGQVASAGLAPYEGQRSCVVITPETKTVKVLVAKNPVPVDEWELETWEVERDGDRTKLRRADGSYVVAVAVQ